MLFAEIKLDIQLDLSIDSSLYCRNLYTKQ